MTQVQHTAFGLVELYTVGLGPSIQSVQIPLQRLPTFKQIDTPPNLVSCAVLQREHSIPSYRSLLKMLNKTGPKTEPWGTPLVISCQLDLMPFTTTLCTWPFSQFFIHRRVHPSKPWTASFSRRMLWGTVSKAQPFEKTVAELDEALVRVLYEAIFPCA